MAKKLLFIVVMSLFLSGCTQMKKQGSPAPQGAQGQNYQVKGLKAAVDLGLTLKCTYMANGATYEGYVKGKQWRGKVTTAQGTMGDVIIREDGCMYSWDANDKNKQGIKACFDPAEMWEQEETMTDIEYKCMVTTVDDNMFTPPSDVTYLDVMNM